MPPSGADSTTNGRTLMGSLWGCVGAALLANAQAGPQPIGWKFDSGLGASATVELIRDHRLYPAVPGSSLRIRGVATATDVLGERSALAALHRFGYKVVALLDWPSSAWEGGVRSPWSGRRLPLDLREAFTRCRTLALTYGKDVDAWEIGNEPDISFLDENPETYASYLKACFLGIRSGSRSQVLMAAMALPPGPYFERFAANGGLDYTDALNYHYYGYSDDFSGVYAQFGEAVERAAANARDDRARCLTLIYPDTSSWSYRVLRTFTFSAAAASANRSLLVHRPLAHEEPCLHPQGQWLVSDGVEVEQTAHGWRFRVVAYPQNPMRSPDAELPLPDDWTARPTDLFHFSYRLVQSTQEQPLARHPAATQERPSVSYTDDVASVRRGEKSEPAGRCLPVAVTEYGYAELTEADSLTAAGRDRQAHWFEALGRQIRHLGVTQAYAYVLVPYEERGLVQFGLLCESGGTPALADLLRQGDIDIKPRGWKYSRAACDDVVLDFVACNGLIAGKSYGGYAIAPSAQKGEGDLVVYNFGTKSVMGRLTLRPSLACFRDGTSFHDVVVPPGARVRFPVVVSNNATSFLPLELEAEFVRGQPYHPSSEQPQKLRSPARSELVPCVRHPDRPANSLTTSRSESFECYFRTANGNLYQTWPREFATTEWDRYAQVLGNFTPAFYGRAHVPAAFTANRPVALAFFFHPRSLPAVFEVDSPEIITLYAHAKK